MNREDILKTLKAHRSELRAHYKVRELSLFGSFARDAQSPASDVDVLVDFATDASFFDLVRLALYLEEKLGRPVDVIPQDTLRAELRDTVMRERVLV
ncbi:MAG: nucleotidyltransferase family protein [Chloroflexota bacterium]